MGDDAREFVPPTCKLRELGGGLAIHERLEALADRMPAAVGEEGGCALARGPASAEQARGERVVAVLDAKVRAWTRRHPEEAVSQSPLRDAPDETFSSADLRVLPHTGGPVADPPAQGSPGSHPLPLALLQCGQPTFE
jgi:hypothetical protein